MKGFPPKGARNAATVFDMRFNSSFSRSPAEAAAGFSETLPEWNLSDLYAGTDSPQLQADFTRATQDVADFAKAYRGKLAEMAKGDDASAMLGEAVARYEALQDLLGRLMSFAGLLYSGDTTAPRAPNSTATCRRR